MRKRFLVFSVVLLFTVLFAACGGQESTPLPYNGPDEPPGSQYEYTTAPVYVHEAGLMVMESFPIQVAVSVSGDLPTPCHEVQTIITPPESGSNDFHIQIYSESKTDVICDQVLQPFTENIGLPLDGLPDGSYGVWLNDEKVGEFNYPGG